MLTRNVQHKYRLTRKCVHVQNSNNCLSVSKAGEQFLTHLWQLPGCSHSLFLMLSSLNGQQPAESCYRNIATQQVWKSQFPCRLCIFQRTVVSEMQSSKECVNCASLKAFNMTLSSLLQQHRCLSMLPETESQQTSRWLPAGLSSAFVGFFLHFDRVCRCI